VDTIIFAGPQPITIDPNRSTIHSDATITASGSVVVDGFGGRDLVLAVNVKAAPTGSGAQLTFSIVDLDPADQSTEMGNALSGAALSGTGTQLLSFSSSTGCIKVSWTIAGSTPSFPRVNTVLQARHPGQQIAQAPGGLPWSVEITDGNNTASVKGASTAAAAGDSALVVSLSPNSPLPAGSSTLGKADQGAAAATSGAWPVKWTDGTNVAAVKAASAAAGANDAAGVVALSPNSPLPQGSNTIGKADQGAAASASNAWPSKWTDGTNVAAVKAASTAAAATDPAGVVSLSPNSPLPSGSNTIGKSDQGVPGTVANAWPTKWTDGSATVSVKANGAAATNQDSAGVVALSPSSPLPSGSNVIGAVTQSGSWTSGQGTAAARSGAWPVKVTDGANTMPTGDAAARALFHKLTDGTNTATVKAASTAAAAADPALVVTLSPNSPAKIFDGTNTASVKAANTAAAAGDTSFVVALSPNSPVPSGTNTIGSVKITDGTNVPAVKGGNTAAAAGDNALVVSVSPNTAVKIGDGTNSPAAVKAASTLQVPSDIALVVRPLTERTAKITWSVTTTAAQAITNTAGTITSVLYVFHPNANSKTFRVLRIAVSKGGGTGTGAYTIRIVRITAENGTPGGTALTAKAHDAGDAANLSSFNVRQLATGAPTRDSSAHDSYTSDAANDGGYIWVPDLVGKPLICRASTPEGFEIQVVPETAAQGAPKYSVTLTATEE
jgi:hypothetical protein